MAKGKIRQKIMKTEAKLNLKNKIVIPEKEYSGKLILRFSPQTHEKVAYLARKKNMSINLLLNIMIEDGIRKENNREKRKGK